MPVHPMNEGGISHFQAMCTQSDWTGRVCRATWHGKHAPWRRIVNFAFLSSWALTITAIFQFYFQPAIDGIRIPILQSLSEQELQEIQMSHEECMVSLCEDVGRTVPVHCVVNDDGETARVEYGEDEASVVFIPEACHAATEKTFGYRFLDRDETLGASPVALINLRPRTADNSTVHTTRSILTLLPECAVALNTGPGMTQEEVDAIRKQLYVDSTTWNDLTRGFQEGDERVDLSLALSLVNFIQPNAVPGHRETNVLSKLFCPEELPQDFQTDVLPVLGTLYNFLLKYRFEIVAVGLYFYYIATCIMTVLWLMVRLLIPAYVMKRTLTWPESITYWDIWRTMVLLCLISTQHSTTALLSALLAAGACYFENMNAAMEWVFLSVAAWGAPDFFPYLDSILAATLAKFDGLSIGSWLIHLMVVGQGWWKLVTLYVVVRSYQSLQTSIRQSAADNVLHETHLYVNNARERHDKVD